jgi:hypothetical protein
MSGDGVRLDRGEYWGTIPPEVQSRVEAGVERIRSVRDAIAADAKVRLMPPITIDPAVWTPDGKGVAHAVSGAWRSARGGHEIGVIVGAGPALCTDNTSVRKILVHEFAHCFETATRVVNNADRGVREDLTGDPMDEEREEAMLGNPANWFGDGDSTVLRWGEPALPDGLISELNDLLQAGRLPFTKTPLVERANVQVPIEWVNHIRTLRRNAG